MKIKVEVRPELEEEEIVIHCKKINPFVEKVQEELFNLTKTSINLSFFKEDMQYFLSLEDILFFETSDNKVQAHTKDNIYQMKYRLYELEELLPHSFIRISKSAIANVDKIYSISHSLTSPNSIQFYESHKQVYVSRFYFKDLKNRLEERRK